MAKEVMMRTKYVYKYFKSPLFPAYPNFSIIFLYLLSYKTHPLYDLKGFPNMGLYSGKAGLEDL